jgi:hypothetical protein
MNQRQTAASTATLPSPPAGAAWVGQPDTDGARFYRFPAVEVDNVAVRVVGVQDVDGFTSSSVGVAVSGAAADLTPAQARQVARLLMNLADRAEDTDRNQWPVDSTYWPCCRAIGAHGATCRAGVDG